MPNILSGYELIFLIDVTLSLVAGYSIGAERESRGKDAGISTHSLVITGAMLFTFLSMRVDPSSQSRIAAQVVTGIGFLGAGLILKEGATVKNLTTAASLWFAGAIGMTFGFGYHVIGIIATVISGIIPRLAQLSRRNQRSKKDRD
ncbi:MAG: MgtC/SapB family protein [Balneolaceae bacterium]|nr:MgtC/SapB family protein [Balneolaceae bacterium]